MMKHRPKQVKQRQEHKDPDRQKWQQVIDRLHSALQLGLRSSTTQKDGGKRWVSIDAEVQLQALRAISAFIAAHTSLPIRPSALQGSLEDSVAALSSLLGAEQETVSSKAADASAALVASFGTSLLPCGGQHLVSPLANLLRDCGRSTMASAATALQGILTMMKPRVGITVLHDSVWKALEGADTLNTIVTKLQSEEGIHEKELALSVPLIDLVAVILERWSVARYRVGCIGSFRECLLLKCSSGCDRTARAALRASSAIALCANVAALQLKDAGTLWSTISYCLHPCKPQFVHVEALQLLCALSKAPTFGVSFVGSDVEGVAWGCLKALEKLNTMSLVKFSPDVEVVLYEAAIATSSILSWPGQHHFYFMSNGIEKLLFECILGLKSLKTGALPQRKINSKQCPQSMHKTAVGDAQSRVGKLHARLRPLFWEILGWLGTHCSRDSESCPLAADRKLTRLSRELLALACESLLRGLNRRGHSLTWCEENPNLEESLKVVTGLNETLGGQHIEPQELVQIGKAVLLLLSSPSQHISLDTKRCLEDALLSNNVNGASLIGTLFHRNVQSNSVKPDHLQTLAILLAIASMSWLLDWREKLLECNSLEVLLHIIKVHGQYEDYQKIDGLSVRSKTLHFGGAKACCYDSEGWEGTDCVLFTALWACAKLLEGSMWAREVAGALREGIGVDFPQVEGNKQEFVRLLWDIAGCRTKAAGVRWWAACCLTSFGIYGFPSTLGTKIDKTFNDPAFADIIFVAADGTRLYAHGLILAARCKTLLPAEAVIQARSFRVAPNEVYVSSRWNFTALKILLKFAYVGIVHIISPELKEIKLLAKRCRMEPLTSLLEGKSPCWGQPVTPYDLGSAHAGTKDQFTDIQLRVGNHDSREVVEKRCNYCLLTVDDMHAHRVVLACLCDYFQALFRSEMRDSKLEVIKLSATRECIVELFSYFYSGEISQLKHSEAGCAWRYLNAETQLKYLRPLVELAELAGQWLLGDLQEQCWTVVIGHLKQNVHLCPAILTQAAAGQQFILVETCVLYLAPTFPQMRDSGALDGIDDSLTDLIRAAHVELALTGSAKCDQEL